MSVSKNITKYIPPITIPVSVSNGNAKNINNISNSSMGIILYE